MKCWPSLSDEPKASSRRHHVMAIFWVLNAIPIAVGFFVLPFQQYAKVMLLYTGLVSAFAMTATHFGARQAAKARGDASGP